MSEEDRGVRDDPSRSRLVLEQDGALAELVYRRHHDRLVLVHTEVPSSLTGRGIGGRLVRAAVDKAAAAGLRVVPACPYARRWLREHPEVAAGVPIDWAAAR